MRCLREDALSLGTFRYRSWGSHTETVSGVARVVFTPTHVVFKDDSGRIIVAEQASSVNRLTQLEAKGKASNRLKE